MSRLAGVTIPSIQYASTEGEMIASMTLLVEDVDHQSVSDP
jgi:hypothetical protein